MRADEQPYPPPLSGRTKPSIWAFNICVWSGGFSRAGFKLFRRVSNKGYGQEKTRAFRTRRCRRASFAGRLQPSRSRFEDGKTGITKTNIFKLVDAHYTSNPALEGETMLGVLKDMMNRHMHMHMHMYIFRVNGCEHV